jgi:hypothetical protein
VNRLNKLRARKFTPRCVGMVALCNIPLARPVEEEPRTGQMYTPADP